jgi:hypothetical protein
VSPTVLRSGPYRVIFYASDRGEPPHVHVARDSLIVKFWLEPVRLAGRSRFSRCELGRIEAMLVEHQAELLEQWDEFRTR